jgi:hypothetical protein
MLSIGIVCYVFKVTSLFVVEFLLAQKLVDRSTVHSEYEPFAEFFGPNFLVKLDTGRIPVQARPLKPNFEMFSKFSAG